jgi:adenosylcobinamide kinase/adenosylcobinamide-phosphate guanylyltransferase
MKEVILVTGGCRSGKSRFAMDYVNQHYENKVFLATADALDDEMKRRIQRHQEDRGPEWTTVEESITLAEKLASLGRKPQAVLIDCLTLWITNLLMTDKGEEDILAGADALVDIIQKVPQSIVMVTNEVGSGIVPENKMARVFRDLVGAVNQNMAACADTVVFTVAGIPQIIKGRLR